MMIASPPFAWPSPVQLVENRKRAKRPKRPDCPHCGSRLLVAEQSRFNLAGRIDHFWACDHCGTEFRTSIEVTRQAVA
jgi:DNA-directed RNA polymerase subunit RPC12/RpoP